MKTAPFPLRRAIQPVLNHALRLAALLALTTTSCLAAATLSQQIDPQEASVGDNVTVTLSVQNGDIKKKDASTFFGMSMAGPDITLPQVDGLQWGENYQFQTISNNGKASATVTFTLIPTRAGDFTIPAFAVPLEDGSALHTKPMNLHVLSAANAPSTTISIPSNPPAPAPSAPVFNPNGPVVMPPNNGAAPDTTGTSSDTTTSEFKVPMESDGRPAKVFVAITPKTTDAYVGQSIPMTIEWYIRLDVAAQQDSLPTIKGSDFLMNNLSVRPQEDEVGVANERYLRESWVTAISAPKSGDFPLQMERDTYWNKPNTINNLDPFSTFFNRPNLAHESISSNQLTIHVHALPSEGRPANFTGAIGHLKAGGTAQPASVAVGEPVTLRFTIVGDGNFDYVRCPSLTDDPAWKSYVPSSKTTYQDDSRTQGFKTFEQAVIPQKNGTLPLPLASFSYFDPTTKQYVTIPIDFPAVTVTGSAALPLAASPGGDTGSVAAAAAPQASDFLPNRLDIGSLRATLAPVYGQPWFWAVQVGCFSLLFLGALFLLLRSLSNPDHDRAERALRQHSLEQEEDAMGEAVNHGDARAFFLAARHAIQLQLGSQWSLSPEALTLGEIRQRDPELATTLEPLFTQADEVIYSGHARGDLDLAQWQLHVRRDLLQPQPA